MANCSAKKAIKRLLVLPYLGIYQGLDSLKDQQLIVASGCLPLVMQMVGSVVAAVMAVAGEIAFVPRLEHHQDQLAIVCVPWF